ncbi:MAG: processive 1,2-diacylglycerol beta-glucosyltransferase [Acidobacteriota bacterium]|nr:processive 1,2-diacylglycerol beta-glucosyltransferase [Acidobacteriota bacterium]
MNILVLTELDNANATFCLRLGFFLDHLKQTGKIRDYRVNDLAHPDVYDLVIIQRYVKLDEKLLALFEKHPKPLIFETDDLLIRLPCYHPDIANLGHARLFWSLFAKHIDGIMVSTDYLQRFYSSSSQNIEVIRNVLPPNFVNERRQLKSGEPLHICYHGTPTHIKDFDFLARTLIQLEKEYSDRISCHFFGFAPHPSIEAMPGMNVYPFEPDYLKSLTRIKAIGVDIGLAPLLNNDFNRSKSSIKYLEYTYAGGIGVYSDVLPYRAIQGGFLVKNNRASWESCLRKLIENPDLIDQEYQKALHFTHEHFRFEQECDRFYSFINTVYQKAAKKNIHFHLDRYLRTTSNELDPFARLQMFNSFADVIKNDNALLEQAGRELETMTFPIDLMTLQKIETQEKLGFPIPPALLTRLFRRAISKKYRDSWTFELSMYRLASLLKRKNLFPESETLFNKICVKSKRIDLAAGAWFHRGEMALRSNKKKKAQACFQKCLEKNPLHRRARECLRRPETLSRKGFWTS